jgi:hypothetical protein
MTVARASWASVTAACVIAAGLLLLNGYTGYSLVVTAVGLSAAVNLVGRTPPDPHEP